MKRQMVTPQRSEDLTCWRKPSSYKERQSVISERKTPSSSNLQLGSALLLPGPKSATNVSRNPFIVLTISASSTAAYP